MALLRLVVDRRAPLHDFGEPGGVEALAFARGAPDFLGERQCGAPVAVGHADQRGASIGVQRQRPALQRFGPRDQLPDRGFVERLGTPAPARAKAARR